MRRCCWVCGTMGHEKIEGRLGRMTAGRNADKPSRDSLGAVLKDFGLGVVTAQPHPSSNDHVLGYQLTQELLELYLQK